MKKLLLLCLLIISGQLSLAQKENNIWYFGVNAGLDFNSGSPQALYDGRLISAEGSASICDENGNLLFYSNGETVWNSNHEVMENGYNLDGLTAVTHPAAILKMPGSENLYYIFS